MMLLNELKFAFRQPIIGIGIILMALYGFAFSFAFPVGEYEPAKQLQVTQMTLLMLLLPIVISILACTLFLRDKSSEMSELVEVTPVSFSKRWSLRCAALTIVTFTSLAFVFSLTVMAFSWKSGFSLQFISVSLYNLALLSAPIVILETAIALGLSLRFGNHLLVYVVFAVLWIGYSFLASINGSPVLAGSSILNESLYQVMLWADPYGVTAIFDNFNSTDSLFDLTQLFNRFGVFSIGLASIYFLLFRRTKTQLTSNKKPSETQVTYQESTRFHFKSVTLELSRFQLIALLSNKITIAIVLLWPLLVFNEVFSGINYSEAFSVLTNPNSIDALNRVAFDTLLFLGSMLLVLWSLQIAKLDKHVRIEELTAVTSIKNHHLLLSQVITISIMLVVISVLTGIGSLVAEVVNGNDWQAVAYVTVLSLTSLPLMLLGIIFISIHHIFKSNLLVFGIIVTILLFKFTPIATYLGITHTFWSIASTPLRVPDNFWGLERSISVYLPYIGLWGLVCLSLLSTAIYRTHRGTQIDTPSFKHTPKTVISVFIVLLLYALSLHAQLAEEKPLFNSHKREAWKAHYEKTFGAWQNKPQPQIIAIDSVVDIYPNQQFANFEIEYIIENQTDTAIEEVLIGNYPMGVSVHISEANLNLVSYEQPLKHGVYQFNQPLKPDEQRTLSFSFTFKQPQLWPAVMHQIIKPEFVYLRSIPMLPVVGYEPKLQIKDANLREEYNLAPLPEIKPSELEKHPNSSLDQYEWVSLSSQISTAKNHTAIAQGELIKQWTSEERNFYQYQTYSPIRAIPTWVSVPFDATSANTKGAKLSVLTPNKGSAAQVNLKAMNDTVNWFTENIAPCKHSQLHLIAMPDFGGTGYALPGIMFIGHRVGFLSEPSKDAGFDQRYRRALHETAHQWFGHDIGNGVAGEQAFLVESMVKYIELIIIEKHYGKEAMSALVKHERERFDQRNRVDFDKTVALINATQSHDQYSRATLAFAKLRKEVGDKPIIAAIKHLWEKHSFPQKPARSIDFINYLKTNTEPTYHDLIDDLFLKSDINTLQ
ncbi:hypothetical protein SOPP22_00760 [Shewanella sp. OPT22]|nr:hypothetical protein SOPP22_00760 [Shewanella sp. OPT22]